MSGSGNNDNGNGRSRSPPSNAKGNKEDEVPVLSFESLWDKVSPELVAFEGKIKNVVGALVNQEITRIEKKMTATNSLTTKIWYYGIQV